MSCFILKGGRSEGYFTIFVGLGVEYNQICKVVDNNGRFNSGRVQDLLNKARIGWWEADFSKKQYVCSDFLRELLDLGEDGIINFVDFRKLIREDYRLRTVNEFRFGKPRIYMTRFTRSR